MDAVRTIPDSRCAGMDRAAPSMFEVSRRAVPVERTTGAALW